MVGIGSLYRFDQMNDLIYRTDIAYRVADHDPWDSLGIDDEGVTWQSDM